MTPVALRDVDDPTLAALLALAVDDATPEEACPRALAGPPGWTVARRDAFLAYHRACRPSAQEPGAERSWAIAVDGAVAGAARLAPVADVPGAREAGVWLARAHRAAGVGTATLGLLADEARAAGAHELLARTTSTNAGALRALGRAGFRTGGADPAGGVEARLRL